MKTKGYYFFRTLCVMVVLPLAFIVIYPCLYMVLPETAERLADLPRDLALFVLGETIIVPLCGVWIYFQVRHNLSKKGGQEFCGNRDVP